MDETTNPETPEVEDLDVEETEALSTELDDTDTPDEDLEPEDDSEEIEHEGQKHRIPKALKDAFLMQADYTRKTQAVAQERQALEAERNQFRQLSQAEINAQATMIAIDQSIAEYNQIDWDAWEDQDPMAANKAWRQFQQLQLRRNTAVEQFSQAQQQRTFQEQQEAAKRMEEGTRELAEKIPGWNQEKAAALLDFGQKTYGFTRQELDGIVDPRYVVALHDAMQARTSKQTAATTRKIEQQQAVKPAAKVKGATPTFKGLDDRMSADAWLAARNKQVADRNR